MARVRHIACAAICAFVVACSADADVPAETADADLTGLERVQALAENESVVLVLGTNDVHGSIDRFPQLAGYVDAARAHVAIDYGGRGSVVVVDAGDATQGTLLSNYSEGRSVVRAMNAIGYTAAIAGNHGFDFGPSGWTRDQCLASAPGCDPLEALRSIASEATFPFLGANVTRTADGKTLDFLPPYVLVPHDGRNIAVLGLENHFTPRTTVPENVAALTFGDGATELAQAVESLRSSGKADVFVLVMHEGDGGDTPSMRRFLEALPRRSDGSPLVDVAIAGHSHALNDSVAGDIPYVQSGANGELFGLVELVVKKDPATGKLSVARERTRQKAGIKIAERPSGFLRNEVRTRDDVKAIVSAARDEIAPIAGRVLASAPSAVSRDGGRLADSEIGNLIADAMRAGTSTDIALINGGDVRDDLPAGDVTYEALFRALPKNLGLVTVRTMPIAPFVENIRLSIKTCGRRGALQISGAKLRFRRDCDRAIDGEDRQAELLEIVLDDGRIAYSNATPSTMTSISVATTDFVMSGGSGYGKFIGIATDGAPQALRDVIADHLSAQRLLVPASYARGRYVDVP